MKTHVTGLAAALLFSMSGLAEAAQTISSAAIPVTTLPDNFACYVRNVGRTPVSVTVQIVNSSGTMVHPDFDNCTAVPLAGGRNCVVLASGLTSDLFACSATASGSAKNLRGTLELRRLLFGGGVEVEAADDLR